MPPPLIGITTHRPVSDEDRRDLLNLPEAYVRVVERAGGLPVLVPLGLREESLRSLYVRLDGLLFTGGGDVDPAVFNGGSHETVFGVDSDRDRIEFTMIRWAASDDKPFLGICRGVQVVNVALGGSLYLDISQIPDAGKHAFFPGYPRDLLAHPVAAEEESLLARAVGAPILEVNSRHHQAIKDPAPGLRVVARAPDGVIEAVELPDHVFGLGVQWHPECIPETPATQQLFRTFVQAVVAYSSNGS